MKIPRDRYLRELIIRKWNGMAKVITGIRRCGKSYLLTNLFMDHLLSEGVARDHIIDIDLDTLENRKYRDPEVLYARILDSMKGGGEYYVFLDEVQLVDDFESLINSLLRKGNVDVYVTGSNSKMLSTGIITEFRGRGDEIRVRPLSFSEFATVFDGDVREAWREYMVFGGMPELFNLATEGQKSEYLKMLVEGIYLRDIRDRHTIMRPAALDAIVDVLSSAIGSLTNPTRLRNVMFSKGYEAIDENTVANYIRYLEDSFLFEESKRFDVKGNSYFDTPLKYYSVDVGLRNARLNFRQTEYAHIMENILYNELRSRGFHVDVGVVPYRGKIDGKAQYVQLEIDFVANKGSQKYYVQSAYSLPDQGKTEQELRPLSNVRDSFKKIVVTGDDIPPSRNEQGIVFMNVIDFLLNPNSLEY